MFIIAVGSLNKAKLKAVQDSCRVIELECPHVFQTKEVIDGIAGQKRCESEIVVKGFNVESGVSNQPMSDKETKLGAFNRANNAMKECPDALYAIGLEGGIELVQDKYFECGWICVLDRFGRVGFGTSGRFELSAKVMTGILHQGKELAEVMDELTGLDDVRSNEGAMGILTNGILNRDLAYSHGIYFAFAPFLSDEKYWH